MQTIEANCLFWKNKKIHTNLQQCTNNANFMAAWSGKDVEINNILHTFFSYSKQEKHDVSVVS